MSNEPLEPGVFLTAVLAALATAWGWITLHFGLKDRVTIIETQFKSMKDDLNKMDEKLDELLKRKPPR